MSTCPRASVVKKEPGQRYTRLSRKSAEANGSLHSKTRNDEDIAQCRNLLSPRCSFVVALGTAGFHYIEGWPWFDGFYMVVTTLTTIGYQEVHPLSHAGRVFNVFIILGGVSLLFLAIGSLTQALLEFELQSFFGRRRMEREIGRLTDHYILCGAGRVGPQRGARIGAPARSVCHHREQRGQSPEVRR